MAHCIYSDKQDKQRIGVNLICFAIASKFVLKKKKKHFSIITALSG